MKKPFSFASGAIALLLAFALAGGSAFAQEKSKEDERAERDATKTKEAQAVSKKVFDQITKAQELIDAEDLAGASKILESLRRKDDLSNYERTNVLNYIGFVKYGQDDTKGAIAVYKEMLQIPDLEPQIQKQTVYTLAQLSTMEENYPEALRLMEQWFTLEPNPGPQPFILYAQNLYQTNRYADMIEPIETAIRIAQERELDVKEDWYTLLNFAYFQQENYAKVRDIQKILLINWPKKRYWFSLAGAFTELGEDDNLVAAYDAAFTQGMLEKESEFVTMAQLWMQQEVPWKSAKLLQAEMDSGTVQKNAKNYRLLSQALTLAQEDEMAIPALKEAARLSEEGELDLRLGNAYLNLGQYSDCVNSVRNGLRKGGIKSVDNANISLGMCLYNEKKYRDAIAAFREAAKAPRSKRVADQWVSVINSDIERNEQIRLAENAARKRQEELAKRRQASDRI